jgi:small subunit ribosomal protein S6
MSKTKVSGLIHYEVLFIIPNKFTDEEAQKVFKKVAEIITSMDGKISFENYWGKKKFAYPINHDYYGYYAFYEFDLDRSLIPEINNKLRLDKDILRFMIVKKDLKTEEQIKKDIEIKEKIEKRKAEEEKEETRTKESKAKKESSSTKKKEEKVDLKKLDKKLDDVLDVDNLL